MKKLFVALGLAVASCQPAMAGERIENLNYTTPGKPLNLTFACLNTEVIDYLMDNLTTHQTAGIPPNGCGVIKPPYLVPLGAETIEYIYESDEGKVYVVLRVPIPENPDVFAFVPLSSMIKKDGGDT